MSNKNHKYEWDKANTVKKTFKFMRDKDKDILDHLEAQPNMIAYIKRLIREDMTAENDVEEDFFEYEPDHYEIEEFNKVNEKYKDIDTEGMSQEELDRYYENMSTEMANARLRAYVKRNLDVAKALRAKVAKKREE